MSQKKVWFVTGSSKGFGLALVKTLVDRGYKVAATSRVVRDLELSVGLHDNFFPLQMDLTNDSDVKTAIDATIKRFGRLDVVVNNAGYCQVGPIEEVPDHLIRQNFEVNVFGTLNVIRHALPQLRKQRSGHIFNISSIAGYQGMAATGVYSATKFAVDGMSESLAQEVAPLGIFVTSVKPGFFRTNFFSEGSIRAGGNPIADYETIRKNQESGIRSYDKNQPGDPNKGMDVLIRVSESEYPPVHLFLGADAYGVADQKVANVKQEMQFWKYLATKTDF
ncbi:SDR family oxidoreductase [Paenibacillus sepulcri]|uniref:SDR family oxidoreductase n=2 Tax=Paenibacillus sepulcri TaxID=359917 RepID=A0ABS7C1W4_9BACL|nr:SDR family oxidoreductase [Paenibacillus sepulcri]